MIHSRTVPECRCQILPSVYVLQEVGASNCKFPAGFLGCHFDFDFSAIRVKMIEIINVYVCMY